MDEKCNNCMDNNINCDVIKQLRKDVLKIKVNRSCLHIIALLICSLGFMVAGLFAFRTFFPISTAKNMVYNIQISGNVSGEISAEIKKELAEALIEVENRAVAAYNEKFTILLTVLTIFGIAWPLVVAILQLRFNEGELKKIKEAEEKANAANELANNMKKSVEEFEGRMNAAFTAQLDIQNAFQSSSQEMEQMKRGVYDDLQVIYASLGTAYIALSIQLNQNYKIIVVAMRMYLEQAKYLCKIGANIDETINSVFKIYEKYKSDIEQYKNEVKAFCIGIEWKTLKESCSQECRKQLDCIYNALYSDETGELK